jgi:3'-phosphoadenosine 5'-phosphosulfate sulfotransferase (PAPS reductase)/FAD synthetase
MDIDLSPYSLILVNTSSGKDSLNIALETVAEARRQRVLHRVMAVHSETGAEWNCSLSVAQNHCRCLGIPLKVVYPRHSIPDYLEARARFPSMKCRYCTALKTSAIDKFIRQLFPARGNEAQVLSITGERAEESDRRAKLPVFEPHKTLTAGNRQVFHYRPIHDWKVGKVWDRIRNSGITPHPAYALGNERLSCALCVFACDQDLWNGAANRPDLAERYLEVERKTGFLFRHKQSLASILEKGAAKCQLQAS